MLNKLRIWLANLILSGITRIDGDEVFYLRKFGQLVWRDETRIIIQTMGEFHLLLEGKIIYSISGYIDLHDAVGYMNQYIKDKIDLEKPSNVHSIR